MSSALLPAVSRPPLSRHRRGASLTDKLEWFGTFRGRVGVAVVAERPSVRNRRRGLRQLENRFGPVRVHGDRHSGLRRRVDEQRPNSAGRLAAASRRCSPPNWSAKIEYLYMDLGSISNSVVLPTAARISSRRKRHHSRDGQHLPRRHQLSLLGRPGPGGRALLSDFDERRLTSQTLRRPRGRRFRYCSLGVGALAIRRPAAIRDSHRAISSAGRAPALHAGCRRFESVIAHQPSRLRRFGWQANL